MKVIPRNAIQTMSGYFSFDDFKSNKITIKEIASVLSKICRYNGHVNKFYSVAAHSILVYKMMLSDGHDIELCLKGLLHDAHEAYIQDMSRPLKRFLKDQYGFDLNHFCNEVDEIIFEQLGISPINKDEYETIKYYDNKALMTEKDIFFDVKMDWGWEHDKLTPDEFNKQIGDSRMMDLVAMVFETIYQAGIQKITERNNV